MRILVTGARDYADPWPLETTLCAYLGPFGIWDHDYGMITSSDVTIVHGACKTGLDFIASEFCINSWVRDEPHPADWKQHGGAAGPIRNEEMARLGADVCLAFPHGSSRGTRSCIKFARQYGIPVIEYKGPYSPHPRLVEWNATHSPY